jgi:hypothetical protein
MTKKSNSTDVMHCVYTGTHTYIHKLAGKLVQYPNSKCTQVLYTGVRRVQVHDMYV